MSTEKPSRLFTYLIPAILLVVYFGFVRGLIVQAMGGSSIVTTIAAALTGAVGVIIGQIIDAKRSA